MNQGNVPVITPKYPLLGDRVQSTFIDSMFIIFMMFVAASVLDRFEYVPDYVRIILFIALWFIYEPLCTTLGGTLGNQIKQIRVRQADDTSKKINFIQSLIRYFFKILLGWISFLTIHSNSERRAIHDLAAGSVMIKV